MVPNAMDQERGSTQWYRWAPSHALPINRMTVKPTFQARIIIVASIGWNSDRIS
ncbi:hypothetical protein L810_1897 [Burkholderia sp. AU4i]|nr:hypothetical protein L810_1897 [Burkholderia sp. AU4i]